MPGGTEAGTTTERRELELTRTPPGVQLKLTPCTRFLGIDAFRHNQIFTLSTSLPKAFPFGTQFCPMPTPLSVGVYSSWTHKILPPVSSARGG